jgi:aminoglycoside phosphotransferase
MSHFIVFSHGDLKHHNITVQGRRITGFIDCESAGWYPDYWDFTTALRFTREDLWWYHFVMRLGVWAVSGGVGLRSGVEESDG